MTHQTSLFTVIIFILTLSGCSTVATLESDAWSNKVYSGTIEHVKGSCFHFSCIDAPFSFVLDTVLLPVTIPWSIYNVATEKDGNIEVEPPAENMIETKPE
jgi:uncharacterized protein YceK